MRFVSSAIRRLLHHSAGLLSLLAVLAVGSQVARAQEKHFQLMSSAFSDNGIMPTKYAGKHPANPNCVGENVSPPLQWANAPDGARSFALIVYDQEGRYGLGVTHWLVYGIEAVAKSLPEGAATDASAKIVNGKNVLGQNNYLGPCPSKGSGVHHYVFTLIATKLEPGALQAGLTQPQLIEAIGSNAIGATGLIGRFGH